MMKSFLTVSLLFLALLIKCQAQKISDSFNPVIKETPLSLKIVQHNDDNYLIFGDINYYGNEVSGSLIKVDENGNLLSDFQKVYTDQLIETVIVLPTGKILIHGKFKYLNGKRIGQIARLNADGSVDPSFHVDPDKKIRSIAVQSTGKIITINDVDGPYQELRRLHEDGTPDNSFTDNVVTYKFRTLLGENDEIYVGNNSLIYRLMPDGTVDYSYSFASEPSKTIGQFTKQDDGKIVAIVNETTITPTFSVRHTLQRFNLDGSIDNSFTAGYANQSIGQCIMRSNGKIAITGLFTMFDSQPGCTMELNPDGSINRSVLSTDYNAMYSIFEDRQQNIFVTGGFRKANNIETLKFIVKLTPNYQLDLSFKVPVSRTSGSNLSVAMAAQSNGKLLVGGSFFFSGVADDTSKIVRLFPDGTVDNSFQPATRNVSIGLNTTTVNAIAVQSDDKIILGGYNIFAGQSASLGRLLADGQLDKTFQVGEGVFNTNYPGTVKSVLIKDSKIYVFGTFNKFNGTSCQSFVILNEAGSMIGPEQHAIPPDSFFQDIEIQSNGKIILMGGFRLTPSDNRTFLRLNTDGSIDNSFVLKTVEGNLTDFEIDRNDNIIVTGNLLDYDSKTIVKRFKPDGEIDPSLDLGSGFKSNTFLTAYFVKALENNLLAIGGTFYSYKDISSPSIVIIDDEGSMIPMEIPFDSTSYSTLGVYANNILYMGGRFSKTNGENYYSGAKVVFPVGKIVSNYKAIATSDSSISLSWEGRFIGADRIVIEQSMIDEANFVTAATIAPNVNSYELRNLDEVVPYHVRIKGVNDSYSSPYLLGRDTTHIAPQLALPATNVTPSSFVANWKYIPGTDSCMLQITADNFAGFVEGYEGLFVTSESLLVSGLEEGKAYKYRVKRFKNNKVSAFSDVIAVNVITAIDEESSLGIKVYPNPVTSYLSIELPSNISNVQVVVNSIDGKMVGEYLIRNDSSPTIDVQNFPAGIFIITISTQGMSKKFKLVRAFQ